MGLYRRILMMAAVSFLLSFGRYTKAQDSPVAINVNPYSVSLKAGESAAFEAIVSGTNVPGVMWSATPPIGTVNNGVYTAPSTINSPLAVTVVARSWADPNKVGSATVWLVTSVGVAMSPTS